MIGKTIGNYQVTSELARGGMGAVYRARHLSLPREVVIKSIILPAERPDLQAHLKARFLREAHIQSRLDHPNIVRVHEFFTSAENYYLVMEYVLGMSLQGLLARQGALAVPDALYLFKQALAAMDYAHKFSYVEESGQRHTGVIHRDIKPGNLLIDGQGRLKITDFGIAKLLGSESLTRSGFNPGTVEYMSPEQLCGHELDARSDLYSLGVTFYEMLSGRLPFVRAANGSDSEVRRGHLELPPPPIRQWRPDLPSGISDIVTHALRKDPNQRFQTADEFLQAVIDYEQAGNQNGRTTAAPTPTSSNAATLISKPLPSASATLPASSPNTAPVSATATSARSLGPSPAPRRRRRGLAFGAAFVLVLLLAGLAALYFKLQNEQSPTALTSTSPTQPISTATPLVALSPDAAVEPMPSPSQPADSAPVETAPSSATAMQPATRSIDQQLFTFALTGCRLAGTIATCDLVITNRDRDRRLALDRFNTLLFDEAGGSYKSLRAQFPNQEGETRLVSGIPTKVQVVFEGLPTQTRKIALLEIAFTGDSYDKVGFRNIVLSNSNAPNSSNLPATLKASQSLDAQLITFALTECRLAGTIVTCALALTNRDRDKRFSLDRFNTKITDETGNVYSCRQTRVANQETEVRLITDVPAGARLVFEGIAPQARKLSKLEIAFTADSYDKTEFRNIPLISGQRN